MSATVERRSDAPTAAQLAAWRRTWEWLLRDPVPNKQHPDTDQEKPTDRAA